MSKTHTDGQVLAECPTCPRTTRMTPVDVLPSETDVVCGCGEEFTDDAETGEVMP